METIPSANARSSFEVQTEHSRRHKFPVLRCTYITGRMIMISITIYFLIRHVLDERKYPYHWLGFLTIHMVLECSVTYSDPLWDLGCTTLAKIHIHWIFAVAAFISGTVYFYCSKLPLFSIYIPNSTGIATSSYGIEPRGTWHCAYSYLVLCLIQLTAFVAIFVTGIILLVSIRLPTMYLHWFHKCGGTLVTYCMIILLACNVFSWLPAPMNWIIFLLTIVAFVLMPVRMFTNRSVNSQ